MSRIERHLGVCHVLVLAVQQVSIGHIPNEGI
jgi:hypothetical protein